MIDELLGRAELKDRIEALEEDKRHLQRERDAEAERRAEAATERQAAEERVNRLEDKVTELEDRIERRRDDEDVPEFRGVETVRGDRLAAILDRLASVEAGPEGAVTAMVDGDVPDDVRDAFGDRTPLLARAAPCLAVTDDAGLVSAALAPPVRPEPFVAWSDGFEFERRWLLPAGEFALALVRSDVFALGEYDGRDRRSFTGFESDVKAAHSKGGFSQGRFERRRDAQIDDHLERCREAIEGRDVERLFVVGERTVLGEFRDAADRTATVDATGDPADALGDAFREFWTARLYRI